MHRLKLLLAFLTIAVPTVAFAQFSVSIEVVQTFPSTCTAKQIHFNDVDKITFELPATGQNVIYTSSVNGVVTVSLPSTFTGPFPLVQPFGPGDINADSPTFPHTYEETIFPAVNGVAIGTGIRIVGVCNADGSAIITYTNGVPSPIAPQVGLWWNPAESGSGYAFDFKHGTLVVTVYSYKADGTPLWYIVTGPVTGNTFTGTLNRTSGGQCISCAYQQPVIAGNDGTMTIVFSSATSGTMILPGGRVIPVIPQAF